ncbi:hypothetical protein M405DRAFT_835931 [Rhizopogon salebrosus TDB-379]|nr:hypothetical protein M405DRAFT_835931 [Rhizopogon salebrosus TDB-379]
MADPNKVIRTDGTCVNEVRHPSRKTEFFQFAHGPEDRSLGHPPFPDVLCQY